MRILVVEFSPSGGLFQFSFQLADHLARQGHRVELLTGPRPELTSATPGFTVRSGLPTWHSGAPGVDRPLWHRVRRVFRGARHVLALAILAGHILRRRPDVVLWQPLRFPVDSWCMILVSKVSTSVMGTVLHEPRPLREQPGGEGLYRSGPILDRSFHAAMRRMDVTFVLSEQVRDYVQETWRPRGVVEVIPHGDERVLLPEGPVPPADRTPPAVLFFGTWTPHKGIDVLLEAFALVRRKVPGATLTLAGAVANVEVAPLRDRAREIGNVELRPGYVPVPQVAELLSSHRVVAVPYLRANQSGVVHLAQTFGRPTVATRVGDLPDVVLHEETGLLVEPGSAEQLGEALVRLLEDPVEAARMGAAAADNLKTTASWEGISSLVSRTLTGLG
jgi:glycosyltransferase involved in cell wall biosynthesis